MWLNECQWENLISQAVRTLIRNPLKTESCAHFIWMIANENSNEKYGFKLRVSHPKILTLFFLTIYSHYSSTYFMGQNADFNSQLNDTKRRFTYFVPSDWAWQQTEIEFPSTHKKLFMPEFHYHVSERIISTLAHSHPLSCSISISIGKNINAIMHLLVDWLICLSNAYDICLFS